MLPPPSPPNAYAIEFPEVLWNGLDNPGMTMPVTVPDGRDLIQYYFTVMVNGWRYEAKLRQPENIAVPNTLSIENWGNAFLISARGMPWQNVAPVFGVNLAQLQAIPPNADLFSVWTSLQTQILELTDVLTTRNGVGAANATKILYQKRPYLFPIVDRYERMALNIPYQNSASWRQIMDQTVQAFLAVAQTPQNAMALDNLMAWIGSNPTVTNMLSLSKVRVLDVIAWCMVEQRYWTLPPNTPPQVSGPPVQPSGEE